MCGNDTRRTLRSRIEQDKQYCKNQEGNQTLSTKLLLHERVLRGTIGHLWSSSRMTGDELHDGAERGPVDRDGSRRTKSKTVRVQFKV